MLWLLSLLFFGAVVVDLYDEVGALRGFNAALAVEIAALQEELGRAASRSDVDALAADLVRLRQAYEESERRAAAAVSAAAPSDPAGADTAVAEAALIAASTTPVPENDKPVPWYVNLKDRAVTFGSQLLAAAAEALRPRPLFH